MLADLDHTLKQFLVQALPIKNGEVEVSFVAPTRDWAAARSRPTINLYLFHIEENTELRRHEWRVEKKEGQATRRRAPFRINLTYMITAWASDPEDEHRLLWRLLAVLLQHPDLPAEALQGDLQEAAEPIKTGLLPRESLPNPVDLWNALGNTLRPALFYQVVLPLDVSRRFTGPLVLKKIIRAEPGLAGKGPFEEIVQEASLKPETSP